MTTRASIIATLTFAVCTPLLASFTGTDVFLPSVGAKPGTPPAVWYTTVWVHNPNATAANVTFYLLERQANPTPVSYTDTIQPGDTARYENAVQLMFAKQTFGAIRVTSNVKVLVGSRIYSQSGALEDSVGQFFAGTPASFAIGSGQATELLGGYGTLPVADSTFRYNFGFVETTGTGTCQVKVTVKDPTGAELASRTYTVRQWEQMQKTFSSEFPSLSTPNARLTVQVLSGTGKLIAFGSGVANGSQDPATFEMAFRDELLAENSSGGGMTEVVHIGSFTGKGISGSPLAIADEGIVAHHIKNGNIIKEKLSATGGTAGQVLTVEGGNLAWKTPASGDLTLPVNKTGSSATGTDIFYLGNTGNGRAMHLVANTDTGLWVSSGSGLALDGRSTSADGIHGSTTASGKSGVWGANSNASGNGVYGWNSSTGALGALGSLNRGVYGESPGSSGVHGKTTHASAAGVYGEGITAGVWGNASGTDATGVLGTANTGANAYGVWGRSTTGYAGFFSGNVNVTGALSKASGSFKIDHPLDPSGKYLYHSFVESPDMKNVYDGNVTTDDRGFATVTLPEWFEALNSDFRYQLTVLGGGDVWAQARVARKIQGNAFVIQTSMPGVEVSWQVTGIRQDAWARAHRIQVEEAKPGVEQGTYLHPELFGQPEEMGVEWATRPVEMKRLQAEQALAAGSRQE
ncbi:MAG: hypothetical protein MUF10_00090 [Thermoanaerobaculaceae bacterium]|jgi:hypothetical protein|nr:hypothetical protein [Thermoanaerobaculaceae bacterium]